MRLKAGSIWLESGGTEDAIWELEDTESTVDVVTEDGFLVLRIDPCDLVAVADAIAAIQKRENESRENSKSSS